MSKKLILVFVMAVFLSRVGVASAGIIINEIALSPIESRFIELYNDGSDSVDLTDWYVQRKTQTGTEFTSLVSKTNFAGKAIGPNGYFVISRTAIQNSDIVVGNLTLTESNTIQIKNQSGEIVDVVCWGDGCSDGTNPGEGKSTQKTGNLWVISDPTPGFANSSSGSSDNTNDDNDTNDDNNEDDSSDSSNSSSSSSSGSSTSAKSSTASAITVSQKIKAEISARDIAYVGIPLAFQGKVTQGGQPIYKGRYFWNFGDGDFREVKVINTDKFTHTYFYPGDYTVMFEHYPDHFAEEPDAAQNLNIRVIEPEISISRVGDASDFFVELFNTTDYGVDMSGWLLLGSGKSFVIPKNTIIGGNKKMIISGRTSGLTQNDLSALKLAAPDGETVFEYFAYAQPPKTKSKTLPKGAISVTENSQGETLAETERNSEPDNLAAAVAYADAPGEESSARPLARFIWPAIFLGFLGAAASGVYFIRQKKVVPGAGDDFKILDE